MFWLSSGFEFSNKRDEACYGRHPYRYGINKRVSAVRGKGEGNFHRVNDAWPEFWDIIGSSIRTKTQTNKTIWCIWELPR